MRLFRRQSLKRELKQTKDDLSEANSATLRWVLESSRQAQEIENLKKANEYSRNAYKRLDGENYKLVKDFMRQRLENVILQRLLEEYEYTRKVEERSGEAGGRSAKL